MSFPESAAFFQGFRGSLFLIKSVCTTPCLGPPSVPDSDLSDILGFDYPAPYSCPPITESEIERAIQKTAPNKAPGTDGITNVVAQSFDTEVHSLGQANGEPLSQYYKQAAALVRKFGGRDRPSGSNSDSRLSAIEEAFLTTIMSAFSRGLADNEIRRKVIEALALMIGS